MIIDLELKDAYGAGPRHYVKRVDGENHGGIVEFCSWGRLADEFVKNSTNPPKAVKQIKVDDAGLHFYLEL
jgi:hypothetical protein